MIELYILIYIACMFICLGWHIEQADSPFVEVDWSYCLIALVCTVLSPIWIMVILGVKLHGERGF